MPILGTFDAPLVQGFAITLAIGVLISMFTALTITRIMMQSVLGTPIVSKVDLFLPLVSLKSDKKIDSNKR